MSNRCPKCSDILVNSKRCDCGWRLQSTKQQYAVSHYCPVCGQFGTISPSTDGSGPWWCSEHFFNPTDRPSAPVDPNLGAQLGALLAKMKGIA